MPQAARRSTSGIPPGWHRHPVHPLVCIVHDSELVRITKGLLVAGPTYTVGLKHDGEWMRPAIPTQDNLEDAIREAEKLIKSEEP